MCFVIAPIGEPESETRKRSDQVLSHLIRPALDQCGYSCLRADQIAEVGMITSQVIHHVVHDALVVADLSERNPNVFYELAIRHAIQRPFVQIAAKGERIPFDVTGVRTLFVDHHDLDSVAQARTDLVRQVQSLETDSRIETPISVAEDLQALRQSSDPSKRSLADVIVALEALRDHICRLQRQLEDPERILPPGYFQHLLRQTDQQRNLWRDAITDWSKLLSEVQPYLQGKPSTNRREREALLRKLELLQNWLCRQVAQPRV